MRRIASLVVPLVLLMAGPAAEKAAAAEAAGETIGPWRLSCEADPMTDKAVCRMTHRDWIERPSPGQPGLALEVISQGGRLVPAVTARDLTLEGAARGLLAFTGTAQLRFAPQPMAELPCALEGRSLICAPRREDAERLATELGPAGKVLVRVQGLGSGGTAAPVELPLAETGRALARFRERVPPEAAEPSGGGLTLRDIVQRLQDFFLR